MKKHFWVLMCVALLLAACNVESTTDIYIQDVVEVQELQETIHSNAILALEFSGDEEDRDQVVDLLQQHLIDVSNPREEEKDYTTYLVVDHKTPLVYASTVADVYLLPEVQDSIFSFAVTPNALNIVFNRRQFDQLDAALYDQMYQHLSFEDFTIRVNLRNDSRDPVEVMLYSVYANTTPIPYSSAVTLERRDELAIRLSDVLRDSVYTPEAAEQSGIMVRKFADLPAMAGS